MRFLFVPKNSTPPISNGDLLEIYLCRSCGTPKEFKDHFCLIEYPRYPRAELGGPDECFVCAKHFDGNEAATSVIIEMTKEE